MLTLGGPTADGALALWENLLTCSRTRQDALLGRALNRDQPPGETRDMIRQVSRLIERFLVAAWSNEAWHQAHLDVDRFARYPFPPAWTPRATHLWLVPATPWLDDLAAAMEVPSGSMEAGLIIGPLDHFDPARGTRRAGITPIVVIYDPADLARQDGSLCTPYLRQMRYFFEREPIEPSEVWGVGPLAFLADHPESRQPWTAPDHLIARYRSVAIEPPECVTINPAPLAGPNIQSDRKPAEGRMDRPGGPR